MMVVRRTCSVDAVEDGIHVAVDRGRAGHVEFQAGGAVLRGVT